MIPLSAAPQLVAQGLAQVCNSRQSLSSLWEHLDSVTDQQDTDNVENEEQEEDKDDEAEEEDEVWILAYSW